MADFNAPQLSDTYISVLSSLKDRDIDLARGLDPATTAPTNVPIDAVRWNSSNNRWEKWSGAVWNALTSTYSITVTNANNLGNRPVWGSGNNWDVVPYVGSDGVMEVGQYLDFHNSDAGVTDFDVRLSTGGTATTLYVNGNTILSSGNYSSYALPTTGGTMSSGAGIAMSRGKIFWAGMDDYNHALYNNYTNIDGEGVYDGIKWNVYAGIQFRVSGQTLLTQIGGNGVTTYHGSEAQVSVVKTGASARTAYLFNSGTAIGLYDSTGAQHILYKDTSNGHLYLYGGGVQVMDLDNAYVNVTTALQQSGNQVLHASNYNSWAMAGAGYGANQNLYTSSNPTFANPTFNGTYAYFGGAGSTWQANMDTGGVRRGYLYADSTGVGFLNYQGNWTAYVPYGTRAFYIDSPRSDTISSGAASFRAGGNDVYLYMGSLNGIPSYNTWIQCLRPWDNAPFGLSIQPNGGSVIIGSAASPSYTLHVAGSHGVTGRIYAGEWIQFTTNGGYGLYWPSVTGFDVTPYLYCNTTGTYGSIAVEGRKNSYAGLSLVHANYTYAPMYDGSGNGGAYGSGVWHYYWHVSNACLGIGTSNTYANVKMNVEGPVRIIGNGFNAYDDAVVYVRQDSNNDWGIIVDKSQGNYDYGLDLRMGSTASYGFRVNFGGAEKFRISYGTTNVYMNGNVRILPQSEAWAEGLYFYMPSTNVWGGIRWQRGRGGYDGNWAIGYPGNDATDDLVFWSNSGGTEGVTMRMTTNGMISMPRRLLDVGDSTRFPGSMAPGALQIGSIARGYGWAGSWASTHSVGILANTANDFEFCVHDSGDRVISVFDYVGDTGNYILLGRDIGWGQTPFRFPTTDRGLEANVSGGVSFYSNEINAGALGGTGTLYLGWRRTSNTYIGTNTYVSGLIFGRGGSSRGYGNLSLSTSGPSGGANGDIWFVY